MTKTISTNGIIPYYVYIQSYAGLLISRCTWIATSSIVRPNVSSYANHIFSTSGNTTVKQHGHPSFSLNSDLDIVISYQGSSSDAGLVLNDSSSYYQYIIIGK